MVHEVLRFWEVDRMVDPCCRLVNLPNASPQDAEELILRHFGNEIVVRVVEGRVK